MLTQLLENTLTGGVLILVTALLRRVLKGRVPPEGWLALWGVCLARLLTPYWPESPLSLYALPRLLSRPEQAGGTGAAPSVPAAALSGLPEAAEKMLTLTDVLRVAALIVGALLLLRYAIAWLRTRWAVDCAILLPRDDPRYAPLPGFARLREGPVAGAPLTFGVVRPTVVLTPGLSGDTLDWVLAHEGVHARRRDNLWHYVMTAALIVHWYNPAVWLMARLLRRDLELSCDRAVLSRLDGDRRAEYAEALISLSTQAEGPVFCRQFGPKQAEERIVAIMKYKKTTAVSLVLALVLVCGVTAAFASVPADEKASLPGNPSVPTDYAHPDSPSGVEMPTDVEVTPGDSSITEGRLMGYGEIDYNNSNSGSSFFYEDEDGNLVPFDGDKVANTFVGDESFAYSSTYVLDDTDHTGPVGVVGSRSYGYEVVDPEQISLDKFKELLAQQVADGEMTQEEADQMLAETQAMVDEAEKNGSEAFIYTDGDGVPLFNTTARSVEASPAAPAADADPAADANN